MKQQPPTFENISSDESVARLLAKEWFVKGHLLSVAFTLDAGETYLSVNRPSVDSYDSDVSTFVDNHTNYSFDGNVYKRAIMNVGEIRDINVRVGVAQMDVDVEVEPRSIHTKSHAGIFTRLQNKNIKRGAIFKAGPTGEQISADTILLEVRKRLLKLSSIEACKFL